MIDNIMIGRLWLAWCKSGKSRRGGRGYVYVEGRRRVGLIWTKIGHLQIMWYTRHYAKMHDLPFIRVLKRATKKEETRTAPAMDASEER